MLMIYLSILIFGVIWLRILFLIEFSNCLQLIYKNIIDFLCGLSKFIF